MKMEALKGKLGLKFWRGRKHGKFLRKNVVEADTWVDADVISMRREVVSHQKTEGEVVRMKILVKKENLEKILEFMRANRGNSGDISSISSSLCLEECIDALKRRRVSRVTSVKSSCHANSSWGPALHSIPE